MFSKRLRPILEEIENLRERVGTKRVDLMAVSKNHSVEAIKEAIESGQHLFGENRLQEVESKFPIEQYNYTLKFIGNIQSNKVRKIVSLVDGIDSVSSVRLLRLINKEAKRVEKILPILLEINSSNESSKGGFDNEEELFLALETATTLKNIKVEGFMTMGPLTDDEKAIRLSFSSVRTLAEKCKNLFPSLSFETLSMGMSGDYKLAILEGSTCVRIGTALFGTR